MSKFKINVLINFYVYIYIDDGYYRFININLSIKEDVRIINGLKLLQTSVFAPRVTSIKIYLLE